MRRTILLLAALAAVPSFAAGQQDGVKRLDGSVISAAQIDATVTQLMTAAEVPGVAVAILNHGEIAYLKA